MVDMQNETQIARVLLIADDPITGRRYSDELVASGYAVRQVSSFSESLTAPMQDPDLIVLCDLAVLAHPGQSAHVIRVRSETTPAGLVREIHRRLALRATLEASMAIAA